MNSPESDGSGEPGSEPGADTGSESGSRFGRRDVLKLAGGVLGGSAIAGGVAYTSDRAYADESGDGLPDGREETLEAYLAETFGRDQFDGLASGRRDLLVDARYVGETSVSEDTREDLEELFRDNGIHLQWLEYPDSYGREWFDRNYDYTAEDILWPRWSFYDDVVAARLKDVAVQVVVVPERPGRAPDEQLGSSLLDVSPVEGDGFTGMSLGNRAVVVEQELPDVEVRLVLHELAHLALCHDDDPANDGVMGPTGEEADLMEDEWARLRERLDNVRDTTGFDVAGRPCLWEEFLRDL